MPKSTATGRFRGMPPWSDLPRDLLDKIVKCLNTEIDVLRFRAVCRSWRSSATPIRKFPRLRFPHFPTSYHDGSYFNLVERTVYRLQLPGSKSTRSWLVKVEPSGDGPLRILNPLSHLPIRILPEIRMPEVLNTLDFRVFEVCKAFALQFIDPSDGRAYGCAEKVVALSAGVEGNHEYVVMAIDISRKLWYIKSGCKSWTGVPGYFYDLIDHKGEFVAFDVWGGAWVFDSSSLAATRIAHGIYGTGSKWHLIELHNGKLSLVQKQLNMQGMQIKIFRLSKRQRKWIKVKELDDQMIFVGEDCSFSIAAQEFACCNGTHIFYSNKSNADFVHGTGVCDFITGECGSLVKFPKYAGVFWPPPSWLTHH